MMKLPLKQGILKNLTYVY